MPNRLSYPHLMAMMFNQPLMIQPEKAQIIFSAVRERIGAVGISELLPDGEGRYQDADALDILRADSLLELSQKTASQSYIRANEITDMSGGIMPIKVHGTLIHRGGLNPSSGSTAYQGISTKIQSAMHDPDVQAVLMNIDSSGGTVSGCFDLVDQVAALAKIKPVWAIIEDRACSAAYAIASACSNVLITQTADVGSIGVITLHMDHSKYLSKEGVKPTIIKAGALKALGNPYEPLDEEAFSLIQASINDCYDLFVEKVAENRNMNDQDVRATEAGVFGPTKSIELGLADGISTADQAFLALAAEVAGETTGETVQAGPLQSVTSQQTETQMATRSGKSATAQAAEDDEKKNGPDEEEEDDTSASSAEGEDGEDEEEEEDEEKTASKSASSASSYAKGQQAERKRMSAIMSCSEAKDRQSQANHIAMNTDMSVKDAKAMLAASPVEASNTGGLSQVMASVEDIDTGTGAEGSSHKSEEDALAAEILAS